MMESRGEGRKIKIKVKIHGNLSDIGTRRRKCH